MRLVSTLAEEPAADKPAESPEAKPDETKPEEPKSEEPKADDKPEEKSEEAAAEKPPEPKYEPLEKVKDAIRETLAGQKAGKHVGEVFDKLSADMRRYADDVDVYNARKESDPKATKPKPFPFADLAKAEDIEAKELPMVTAAEASQEDLGKVYREVRRGQFGPQMEPFDQFAYNDSLLTFKPMALQDLDGNAYLFWKTEEKAAYVPTLDEVKDKVVRAWKSIEARSLAKKRADEYAAQAREAKKSLKEVFGPQTNLKVIESGPFSWMTLGNVPSDPFNSQPRMSQVEGVENVGAAFMESVFGLAAGDVGVAMNHPEDTVYVVRPIDFLPPLDELRKDFAGEHQMRYMAIAGPDQRRIYLAWLDDLEKDAGVHWVRPPDTGRRTARAAEGPEEGDF